MSRHLALGRSSGLAAAGLVLGLVASLAAQAPAPTPAAEPAAFADLPAFKVYLREEGVYRLRYEDLQAAGLSGGAVPAAGLGLTSHGKPVPVELRDGGDGAFGPGDSLVFLGEHLAGDDSYYNRHSELNVYRLRWDLPRPARFVPSPPPAPGAAPAVLEAVQHLEADKLLLRFSRTIGPEAELWYWAKLNSTDKEPLAVPLDLGDFAPGGGTPARLRVAIRGWSWQREDRRGDTQDHRVEVALNGVALGSGEWNVQEEQVIEVPRIPAGAIKPAGNQLTLRVPSRRRADGLEAIVDVVVLNWIEIVYPRRPEVAEQARFRPAAGSAGKTATVVPAGGGPLAVYGGDGSRAAGDGSEPLAFTVPAGEPWLWAVHGDELRAPAAVERDQPSHLADPGNQADYIVITHRRLAAAVAPLVDFHRRRGLAVTVADIEDVYDEFSDGIVAPEAIRRFLDLAYHRWRRPGPRFVLLVGDASWDPKAERPDDRNYVDWAFGPNDGTKFRKNRSTSYSADSLEESRNLIPAWTFFTSQGHAASDNDFVAVDGDDVYPDLAIGRFPVVTPEEVSAIVEKTIRYAGSPELGPWRHRALWITNEEKYLQQQSDLMAGRLAAAGIESRRIYPGEEAPNEQHQLALRQAFDDGFALVHFIGHGGRYIWRTGAADLTKNHDLFTLDDLDRLAPSEKLAVVLSMTCYSAPYDHPTADSIGEKFLRLEGRGAVAVVAASWRNSPLVPYSNALLDELLAGPTIGEAFMRSKRAAALIQLIELYNLLGDPAIPLSRPAGKVEVEKDGEGGATGLRGRVDLEGFAGLAQVDFLGPVGEVLLSRRVEVRDAAFALPWPAELPATGAVRAISVYAWNDERRLDAGGALELEAIPPPSALQEPAPPSLDEPGP